jgi:hypothetical protein
MIGMINQRRQGHLSWYEGAPWRKAARAGFRHIYSKHGSYAVLQPARARQRSSRINSIAFVPCLESDDGSVRDYRDLEQLGLFQDVG